MKNTRKIKEAAPMPSDSESGDDKSKYYIEYSETKSQPLNLKEAKINEDKAVIEEVVLLDVVDALPDLSQDEKGWATLQSILHPQPTGVEIEEDFLCPITQSLIRDPVTTVDGQMYEREAIEQWFSADKTTSPITNKPLESKQLTPNVFAKKQINTLVEKNPGLKDSEEWYLPQSWIAELKTACQVGNEKLIRELINRDRRLLVLTFKESPFIGQTALHLAAAVAHPKALDVVIELLESRQKGLALAALLQSNGEGRLPIHCAALAKQDTQTLLKLMTWMGKQISQVQPLPGGWPPGFDRRALNEALAWSVGQEDVEKIRCFLRLGADPQAKTASGETRVYQAVKKGCSRSLMVLLESKADPNLNDPRLDDSPLHAVIRRGDPGMVIALLKAEAKENRALSNGRIPLHLAAERNDDSMLKALAGETQTLSAHLCEAQDAEGCTPLHRAAASGSVSAVAWLLDHGANPQAMNANGQTALHLAARANRADSIALLLERGASLSATDHQGNTALHIAAEAGANDAVAELLKTGIAAGLKNKTGKTARQLAEGQNHVSTVKQLDQTVAELQAAEEKALKGQGILGIFLLKQQQIIRDQQAQIEVQQEQIQTLRGELTQLVFKEIKPVTDWRGGFFTPDREQMIMRLTDREKISFIKEQREIKQEEEARQRAEAEAKRKAEQQAKLQEEQKQNLGLRPTLLPLQNKLITACKQGDLKGVQEAFRQGAKAYALDEKKDEHPLGAAVWGMNPDVVNEIIQQAGGVAPVTWDECEKHNQKYYKEVFIVPKFDPQTFGEWKRLLHNIEPNPFIRAYHLKMADKQWHDYNTTSWVRLTSWVGRFGYSNDEELSYRLGNTWIAATEAGYVSFRTQIKQGVETAKRPSAGKTF